MLLLALHGITSGHWLVMIAWSVSPNGTARRRTNCWARRSPSRHRIPRIGCSWLSLTWRALRACCCSGWRPVPGLFRSYPEALWLSSFSPAQELQKSPDVLSEGGQVIGDRPEPINSQRIYGQAPKRGHDLNAVDLALAVSVLELGIAGPVPGVLDRPTVTHVTQQILRASAQTRVAPIGALSKDVVTTLVGWLAIAAAFATQGDHRVAARSDLHYPFRCWHAPDRPSDVTVVLALAFAGLQHQHINSIAECQ